MHLTLQQSQKLPGYFVSPYDTSLIASVKYLDKNERSKDSSNPANPSKKTFSRLSEREYFELSRFENTEQMFFDDYINKKTGYNRELMKLYGAELDPGKGIAVPIGTLGNNANKVNHEYKSLPVSPTDVLSEPKETPSYIEKKTRYKNYQLRNQLQKLQIQPKRCQSCASETIGNASTIYSNINTGTCQVDKLETCGSVWACPVCRMKILNTRQDQLNKTVDLYKKDNPGGQIQLLTFTIPHSKAESLADLKDSFLAVFKRLLQSKTWVNFRTVLDGYDRAIECTWGQKNGWHFHIHMLTYTPVQIDLDVWDYRIRSQWSKLVKKYLKKECNKHAFDIRPGEKADYLAKWAGVNEMTSTAQKSAKNGNYSISDLENCVVKPDLATVDGLPFIKICSLLYEYYTETHGNHLITHSQTKYRDNKSLRNYYIQDDKTDEEIAHLSDEDLKQLIPVAEISAQGVRLLSENNHLADLKDIFEQSTGTDGAYDFVCRFPQYSPFIKPLKNYTELPLFYFHYAQGNGKCPFENELYKQAHRIEAPTKLKPGVEIENHVVDDLQRLVAKRNALAQAQQLPDEVPF